MKSLLLGIDIGTSSCKTALFNRVGEVVAQHSESYETYQPKPGWAEQNPEEWWEKVCFSLQKIWEKEDADPKDIVGIGIAGQSWSAIPIDADGEVLLNTPIWMDTRANAICEELKQRNGEEKIFEVSGNSLQPTYTLPKILWYKKHFPEVYEKTDKILQSNGYIAYKLTGVISQDICQAYGYQCFNMRKGNWDVGLCAELGVRYDLLPEIVPCHQVVGTTDAQSARETGLPEGIPVVAGGLDAACGALGAGVLDAGETQEQGGQAGGMSICMQEYCADPRLILSWHVVPDRWLLQGGTVGGGGVFRWLKNELYGEEYLHHKREKQGVLDEMNQLAAQVPAGSEGVLFLPYMSGERSPIWNAHAKAVFYGLDFSKKRGHMIRAAMEGVAYSLEHNLEVAREAGAQPKRLRAVGGAANSQLWTQMKADVTNIGIDVPASDHATTLGAALLAGVGVHVYSDFDQAVEKTVRTDRSFQPNVQEHQVYKNGYAEYIRLYQSLKDMMKG